MPIPRIALKAEQWVIQFYFRNIHLHLQNNIFDNFGFFLRKIL